METFHEMREFVVHEEFPQDREKALAAMGTSSAVTDRILTACADPGQLSRPGQVQDRLHRCLENSRRGRGLRDGLSRITAIDPGYVQFGSPDWFWNQWRNSYALQVEPLACRSCDEALVEVAEALHILRVIDMFFNEIRKLLDTEVHSPAKINHLSRPPARSRTRQRSSPRTPGRPCGRAA